MALDVERLVKLLAMTTSSHDNEALTAIRKVNAMLSEHGLTWSDFVRLHTPYYQEPAVHYHAHTDTPYRYERPQRYGFYPEEVEAEARRERERQAGARQRAEREKRQAERDRYAVKGDELAASDGPTANDWAGQDELDETHWRHGMVEHGFPAPAIVNFEIFAERHPDVAQWLWQHRDDDTLTKLSWKGAITYPLRMGPLHLAVLRRMMIART
jgi:hypothetical protein